MLVTDNGNTKIHVCQKQHNYFRRHSAQIYELAIFCLAVQVLLRCVTVWAWEEISCCSVQSILNSVKHPWAHKQTLGWVKNQTVILYLRTAPQYLQSTKKIGLRALVTRKWDVCRIRTTMASTNCTSKTHVCTKRQRENRNRGLRLTSIESKTWK